MIETMDEKQLQLFILKRDLQSAIQAIDGLIGSAEAPKRRGRPPKSESATNIVKSSARSEESRQKQAERMKLYWANRKKAAKKAAKD